MPPRSQMVQEFYYHLVTFVTDAYLLLKGSVPVFCIVFITVGNSLIINFVPPPQKKGVGYALYIQGIILREERQREAKRQPASDVPYHGGRDETGSCH